MKWKTGRKVGKMPDNKHACYAIMSIDNNCGDCIPHSEFSISKVNGVENTVYDSVVKQCLFTKFHHSITHCMKRNESTSATLKMNLTW